MTDIELLVRKVQGDLKEGSLNEIFFKMDENNLLRDMCIYELRFVILQGLFKIEGN